jgi:hypothetical protein
MVCIGAGVEETLVAVVLVSVVNGVTLGVVVLIFGVTDEVAAPITTGVAVKTDGGCVNGAKGVGALPGRGWMTQPLHDDSKSAVTMKGAARFIFSPRPHCILVDEAGIVPRL